MWLEYFQMIAWQCGVMTLVWWLCAPSFLPQLVKVTRTHESWCKYPTIIFSLKTSNPCTRYNLKCASWEELSSLVPPSVEDKVMSMEAHKLFIRFLDTWWNIVVWFWPRQLHLVLNFRLGSYFCHVFQNMVVLMDFYVAWLFETCDDAQLFMAWTWIPFEVAFHFVYEKSF